MHSAPIRWLVVFKRYHLGLSWTEIEEHVGVGKSTGKRWVVLYKETGAVMKAKRLRRGRPRSLTMVAELGLVETVLDAPRITLGSLRATLQLAHGKTVSIPTLCRVLHRHGFTRQRVQHFAMKRDADRARLFLLEINSLCTANQILVVDETAKDRRTFRATIGWGLRGCAPFVRDEFLTRGDRVSALTLLSHRRFEDWRFTKGTFNRDNYQVRSRAPRPERCLMLSNKRVVRIVRSDQCGPFGTPSTTAYPYDCIHKI